VLLSLLLNSTRGPAGPACFLVPCSYPLGLRFIAFPDPVQLHRMPSLLALPATQLCCMPSLLALPATQLCCMPSLLALPATQLCCMPPFCPWSMQAPNRHTPMWLACCCAGVFAYSEEGYQAFQQKLLLIGSNCAHFNAEIDEFREKGLAFNAAASRLCEQKYTEALQKVYGQQTLRP